MNEELVALFFNYLIKDNSHELRLMPDFSAAKKPDWDELSRFVFIMCDQVERDDEGTYTLTKNAFEETVKRFFAEDFAYTHRSSTYLKLAGDMYTPTDWDFHGATYYRLFDLILSVLQDKNYAEVLVRDQQLEITFELSDDPIYAFKYLSSKRNYIGQ